MSNAFWIQVVGAIVAIACALPGVFLVLRRSAMVSDAISHTVLFGIVVGFLVLDVDPTSPILILTAALSGLLTVWLIELLQNTKRLSSDAAIGLVFPILFSIAVILINTQIRNAHVDEDAVLLGHLIFAPVNRLTLFGLNLPEGIWVMGAILLINLTFLVVFYKELKITTFDPGLAAALGISPCPGTLQLNGYGIRDCGWRVRPCWRDSSCGTYGSPARHGIYVDQQVGKDACPECLVWRGVSCSRLLDLQHF